MTSSEDTLSVISLGEEPLGPAPEGYYVKDACPNDAEKFTFTCPYVNCDGWCRVHFAAQPALQRHAKASKHDTRWLCQDVECEQYDVVFETSALFYPHVPHSSGHKDWRGENEIAYDTDSAFTPSLIQSTKEDDVFGPVSAEPYVCNEPCCRHYRTDYKGKSEFIRHADTCAHQFAANLNKALLSSIPTLSALRAEQEALRSFRCTSPGCDEHGTVFKHANAFFRHLKDDKHRSGWSVNFDDEDLDYSSDRDALPGIQFYAGGKKGRCINKKCPRYRFQFDSYTAMKKHSRSFGHALTEQDLHSTDAEDSGEEAWKKSDVHGMDVAENGLFWKCTKQGCKKFNVVIRGLGNAKSHFGSAAHLEAAEELNEIVSSSEESFEHLEGMEYSKDDDVWTCVKRGCKRFNKVIQHFGHAKRHAVSDNHALAEEPDYSDENLEGMEYSREEGVWTCIKPGCKRINAIFQHHSQARKHVSAKFHALAEEPSLEDALEDIDGMMVLEGETAYICVKFGCRGSGKIYSNVRAAKLHANAGPHMRAGEMLASTPTQSAMGLFTTPKRTPQVLLPTPMDTDESTIFATPGSPSAGRGINHASYPASTPQKSTATQAPMTIRLQRSSLTKPSTDKRQMDLENKNRVLEARVAKLEMQMGQVLRLQSPQNQHNVQNEQTSQVQQTPGLFQQLPEAIRPSNTSCARVEGLSRFVRAAFRPKMPRPENEDEL
ncbi:hypothetical protein FBEOM_1703 [Fusarium beomiforme]|uniref:C2H2-type domain-containing protein n=1 Tax=Fusarium beomiforme TaxID=44412 RepID=A0A9P5E3S1_9HYPO|nr:hypothetical protein FBEOM_1703 [Fusarium beomiforme]